MTRSALACAAAVMVSAGTGCGEPPVAAVPNTTAAKEKAALKARAAKYLESATPGVRVVDEQDLRDGRYVRVFVVGTATISTVLGPAEGLEIARERAEESAKAEFVKWLGSQVTVRTTSTNEDLIARQGQAGEVTEQGKAVERRTKEYEERASALVRGLRPVAYEQKGTEQKLIIVYRWDARPDPARNKLKGRLDVKGPGGKSRPGTVPDRKVILDD